MKMTIILSVLLIMVSTSALANRSEKRAQKKSNQAEIRQEYKEETGKRPPRPMKRRNSEK